MGPDERRNVIWHSLCSQRQVTARRLSIELGVSLRTVYRDLEILSLTYPIESIRGRYGGGYKLCDWFFPKRTTLCKEQVTLLKQLALSACQEEARVLCSILTQFSP